MALKILEDDLKRAETNDALGLDHKLAQTDDFLGVLARKPYAFIDRDPHFFPRILKSCFGEHVKERESEAMQLLKIIWKNILEMSKEDVDKKLRGPPDPVKKDEKGNVIAKRTYSSRVLFVAAEMGNTKFVVELIRQCPDLIWKINDNNQSIFHIAVSHRHESIYNLLHEIGSMKDLITPLKDPEGNNMGVAFQMQWELLWFKEVESMIPPSYRERKNAAGKTPRELFTENHKELVSRGEQWMRATTNQCMVVAALIATIVFGVAFSIPGGYDQKNGFPMFIRKEIFIAFVISDAISLIFSSASILMFLSIVTSRYDEQDFFEPLPRKLMIGLATLFLSIMTMMIAFSFSFFGLYHNKLIWVPIVISSMAAVPVILLVHLCLYFVCIQSRCKTMSMLVL
ncbi:putative PGG domain, ankyrin repeat-containing domain superfamily [Helianthus annuus]|nr:putative PGG domain, ankyrin repeat-containing domain superfamily [Helianthus annuus]KAJ0624965.1 putative PGG domain, ankyrin repeat-containing domain superfamily [Helianthus annuus]KAJ0784954.1 putative PGG domain, ankyrin repeat-containing domain superfamily [Helianthus annuus]KAJ0794210.1 putative PGG domain, ankyrin repeat-containing domain superfamily [Helianthus annuus]